MKPTLLTMIHSRNIFRLPSIAAAGTAVCLLTTGLSAWSQQPTSHPGRHLPVIPAASRAQAGDKGVRLHANVRYIGGMTPDELPPYSGYGYDTPASLACIYGLASPTTGCNPNATVKNSTGGSQTIAIVDAYDDPNAAADLAFFSAQFGLPYSSSKFKVVYAQGSQPAQDPSGGWEFEESLDIEYAHAMAPKATIYLVEAASNYDSDLFPAILVASNLVACGKTTTCPAGSKGKGEVSMSFGGEEFAQELSLDPFFTTPGVVYFAASGDAPGVGYPCASPNVVCVGGTSNSRSLENGNLIAQISWSEAGGGASFYEPIPKYQAGNPFIARQLQGYRGVPDLSAVANLDTGVWVWDTIPDSEGETGWFIGGGTSLATPVVAGIVNSTGDFAASSSAELTKHYSSSLLFLDGGGFTDIVYGACNFYSGTFSSPGWDQCTGLGTPNHLK
ncbi:MAG TPA: S53 family peptidase [Acidobacteriaceae bacterium]|jgi:subtilase family serine protease|nr:S53 family peptidase [Acidobacteriaceae bacterium]